MGLVALIPLLFYAFVRASYEEYRAAIESHTESGAATMRPQPQSNPEVERLQKQLRRTEQELDRYRAIESDPTAKQEREDEVLKGRCLDLAETLGHFAIARRNEYDPETIIRFKLRYEPRVTKLRDDLQRIAMTLTRMHATDTPLVVATP